MEYETYADVIDAYNSGVAVVPGESLTDYIKRNNIKIKEIEMSPLEDLKKTLGSRPMEKEGIMQMASGKNMDVRIEEIVREFIKQKGRRPRSLEEIKEFFMNEMGTASDPAATNMSNVRLARYEPGKYSDDEIQMYEQYKYDMNEQRPGMPIMDIDEFLRIEQGQARAGVAAGGLPAILGV
tara:strand:- start:676 stop:1218 length:543 start_codon:yes stop_codon:yes gene_type:complete